MTQEEKAKAYDEAIERMKSWVRGEHPECFTEAQKAAEFIFPELKELEDDKTKEEIMIFLRRAAMGYIDFTISSRTYNKWLDWVERQSEHKSAIKS